MTNVCYFVDTRTKARVLKNSDDWLCKPVFNLQTTNRKLIAAYGKWYVYLNVGLYKPNHWIFVVAVVSISAIESDLTHHNLLTDTRKWRKADGHFNPSACVTAFLSFRLSELLICPTTLLGITGLRTTAYHPQASWLVERFHRQIRASLPAAKVSQWIDALPLVLLSIFNPEEADVECTATQLVCRTEIRPPGGFVDPPYSSMNMGLNSCTGRLINAMHSVILVFTRHYPTDVFAFWRSTHVFILQDSVL